jgi:hypothetical protein
MTVQALIADGVHPVTAERTVLCGDVLKREASELGLALTAAEASLLASVVLQEAYRYDVERLREGGN